MSEPELRSAAEAVAYLKVVHSLIRYLGISDGNMAEGSMRCDANVSIRPRGATELGTRTEIKNVNSFRFVEKAIEYEIERQVDVLESGGRITQETRLYDSDRNETRPMRSKEEANDYRYFPDPDLLPVVIDEAYITALRDTLPELPRQKQERFTSELGLSAYDAEVLSASRDLANFFEETAELAGDAKLAANWVMGEVSAHLNRDELDITSTPVSAATLAGLLLRIRDNTISGKIAKSVFEKMWAGEGSADAIIEKEGLRQVTDSGAIEAMVDEVIAANPEQVEQYRSGKDKVFGFFVGQIMKASRGKANPAQVNELLRKKLAG